jgi:hypothetical protein
MWGTLPFGSSLFALLVLLIPAEHLRLPGDQQEEQVAAEELEPGRLAI